LDACLVEKSFILQHVSEPDRLIMASTEATGVSLIVIFMSGFLFSFFSSLSFWVSTLISIFLSILSQIYMIYKTHKDPYFFNVWMAALSCKKTKNYFKLSDNHYGD
ncbi:MAG TPA: hypothetical protein PK583_01925, partial [Gammaproteobacteria bacterium]|nr:hypothetical protein [Gammaproteobacteria bacterium]HQY22520.1 hypothetical protein [Gammaproteobacteria bacterium]